jgi:hypothetical protein
MANVTPSRRRQAWAKSGARANMPDGVTLQGTERREVVGKRLSRNVIPVDEGWVA